MIGICNLQFAGPTSLNFLLDLLKKKEFDDVEYDYSISGSVKSSDFISGGGNFNIAPTPNKAKSSSVNLFSEYQKSAEETQILKNTPNAIMMLSFSVDSLQENNSEWMDWENKFEHICGITRPNDSETGFGVDNDRYVWKTHSLVPDNVLSDLKEGLVCGSRLLNFFCNEEVLKITDKLTSELRMSYNSENTVSEDEVSLYHLDGRAHLYKHEYEDALVSFDIMYEKAQYRNNTDDACRAYIELAYTHIFRSDFESVLHFAEMAAHLGELSMNMRLVAISNFCLFVSYDRSSIKFGETEVTNLISNLERQDLVKEQTYVLRNYFAQCYLSSHHDLKLALEYCNKAVNIANRFGIKHELAASHHCRGIILYDMGKIAEALHAYCISEEIYKNINVPIELTHVYSSIGYLFKETEDYARSHEYHLKVLRNSIKLNDYSEISITLYNLSNLYLLTGLFKEGLHTLNILQEVMSIRGTNKIPFHNMHHIILNKAYAYINLGEYNFAQQMLKRSYNLRSIIPMQSSEKFLYDIMQARVYNMVGDKFAAIKKFETLELQIGTLTFNSQQEILYYLSGVKVFSTYGMFEQSYKYFRKGYDFATKRQLFNSQRLLRNAWRRVDDNVCPISRLDTPLNEFSQIVPLIQQEKKVNILWRQVHELRLGSMLHNFSLSVQNDVQLAGETLRLLSSHFNVNGGFIYYVDPENGTSSLLKEFNASREYSSFSFAKVQKFVNSKISNQFQQCNDVKIGLYQVYRITIYPLMDRNELFGQMMLFTFDNKTDNTSESSDSITFIAQQLSSQLVTLLQRIKLIRVSTTDMLTGLYNRMEFHSQLSNTIAKTPATQNIALGFIDLDNFKYYNDNLGHDIGDKLLVWFAELLNSKKKPSDVACRWGGDEFLLLMKNCNAEEAEARMQNILDELKAKNGYKKEIEEFLGEPVNNLPERYYLSCSIGVMDSSSLSRPINEQELLHHADEALYEVKRTGKGRVLNFENMTHEADNQIIESNR